MFMSRPTVYSIGHSNHSIDALLDLLLPHGIEILLDVRSAPYSRYSPHFNKRSLQAHLTEAGIEYRFAGESLGGRPDDERCYDDAGQVDYARIALQPGYREGIHRLVEIAAFRPVAMMCSEEDPGECHRHKLIADTLIREHLADVLHIRGDGAIEAARLEPKQAKLF
jgi:uncharacterized protein (DUF488 family)